MRIAFLHPGNFFRVQGSTEAYYVYNYLKKGHDMITIIGKKDKFTLNKNENQSVRFISVHRFIPHFIWYNLMATFKLVTQKPSSMNLIYSYKDALLPPLIIKTFYRKKWVLDLRTSPVEQELEFRKIDSGLKLVNRFKLRIKRYLYTFMLARCDLIITLSEEIKDILINSYRVKPEKIYIQSSGVEMKKFYPINACLKKSNENKLKLVYITSIDLQRGIQTVIKALEFVNEKDIPVSLSIIGSGPKKVLNKLKRLAADHEVSDRLEWIGFVPHHKLPEILNKYDIGLCILPDLKAYEVASPVKLLEYLATGNK